MKRETESLIIAAQNQSIRTNHIKAVIDKSQTNSKCRMCLQSDETIFFLNVQNLHRRNIKEDMIGWGSESTGKFANYIAVLSPGNGMNTIQSRLLRMKLAKSTYF